MKLSRDKPTGIARLPASSMDAILTFIRANRSSRPLQDYVQGALLLGTIVPLSILAAVTVYVKAVEQKDAANRHLETAASHIGAALDEYIDKHVEAIQSYASFSTEIRTTTAPLAATLRAHHTIYDGFVTMLIADRSGDILTTSPPRPGSLEHVNVSDRPYFQTAIRTGTAFVSDVFEGRGFGTDAIIAISAPLRNHQGEIDGIVEGSINLNKFARFNSSVGGADVLILDQHERVIFSSSKKYKFLQSLSSTPLLAHVHADYSLTFYDQGEDALAAQAVNRRNWRVLTTQPMQTLRREIAANIGRTLLWLVGVVGLSLFLARMVAARITEPLSHLLAKVRNLELGRARDPVHEDFSAAPREVEELAATFDHMSAALISSYRELRRAKEDLEDRVEQRTLELAAANRALQAENINRLQAQATLLLRDRAIASASEGIIISDAALPDNPIIYANSGFEKISGYSAAEVVGRNCRFLQGPDTDRATAASIGAAIRKGQECSVEILNYRKDGTPFWNRLSITPVHDETGGVTHFIGIQSDITHAKQIERLKTELVGTVSHELRTPLTSLRGFAELLLHNEYPRARQLHFLGIMHSEATRLGELINDFLDLQRIESGRQAYRFAPLSLETVIDEITRMFGEHTDQHRIVTSNQEGLPPVNGDDARIRQVLTNLVGNAVKFSPQGGRVRVSAHREGGSVICAVEDEGIGIAPEVIGKLFTRFFRADNSATRSIGGTGLGLELVKRIVEAHQGRVWVESTLGKGSTFFFSLPVSVEAESRVG